MGYGPVHNGRQGVITPYKGSWAWAQEQRLLSPSKPIKQAQWPIGLPPKPNK